MNYSFEDALAECDATAAGEAKTEGSACRLRVTRGDQSLVLYGFENEELAHNAIRAHTILGDHLFAVPEVLESGATWMLVDCGAGVPVSELIAERGIATLGEFGRSGAAIATSIGNVLAKLHNVPVSSRFGDPESKESGKSWLTFSGYVAAKLEIYFEDLRKRSFSESQVQLLSKSVADLRHELASFHPRTPTSWIHGRPGIEHFWVTPETLEIVALTGLEHSRLLPREADIASLIFIDGLVDDEKMVRSLYHGYGAARTMDVQRRERFYRRFLAIGALMKHLGEVRLSDEALFKLVES